jgi:hypothetical protein
MKHKFTKRVFALALSLIMAVALFVPVMVVEAAGPFLVWSLSADEHVQGLEVGFEGSLEEVVATSPFMQNAGSPNSTVVESFWGTNGFTITGRTENWHAVDLARTGLDLDFASNIYFLSVVGRVENVEEGLYIVVGGADSPWDWIANVAPDENGYFILEDVMLTADIDAEGAASRIRINTNQGFTNDMTIEEITVIGVPVAGAQVDPVPIQDPLPPNGTADGDNTLVLTIGSTSYVLRGQAGGPLDVAPSIVGGRTMVPFRFIGDVLGATVDHTPAAGGRGLIAHFTMGGQTVDVEVGVRLYNAAGDYMGTPFIEAGRTLVPFRFVSEAMGAEVDFTLGAAGTVETVIVFLDGEAPTPQPEPQPEPQPDPVAPAGDNSPGIVVNMMSQGDEITSAVVVIGGGTDAWPYASAADEYGTRAFTPQPGTTYRISFNVTSEWITGYRVRWLTGTGFGPFTAADGDIVNDYLVAPGVVATVIPAHFNDGFSVGGTYTLVVEFTLDGAQGPDGLIGNIGLFGTGGGHSFDVNWVTVETGGQVIAQWTAE